MITLAACNSHKQWDMEYDALLQRSVELNQRHEVLKMRTDSLWDVTTDQLASSMPAEFPPVDRDIFLNARNADHIRMFMSFKLLNAELQDIVNKAGEYDAMIASEIHVLMEEHQRFEHDRIAFIRKVEAHDAGAGRMYADKFRTL